MSCPMCGQLVSAKYRPFCSRRCADLDLANWLNGSYTAPSDDVEDLEEALEAAQTQAATFAKPN